MQVYSASLSQKPSIVFGTEGGTVAFHFPMTPEILTLRGHENLLFYRSLADKNTILMSLKRLWGRNCCREYPTASQRLLLVLHITYTAEIWRKQHHIKNQTYHMVICLEGMQIQVDVHDSKNENLRFDEVTLI